MSLSPTSSQPVASSSSVPASVTSSSQGNSARTNRKRWRPKATAWLTTWRSLLFFAVTGALLVMVTFELDEESFALFYKNNPFHSDTDAASERDHLAEAASFYGDWWGLMVLCALCAGSVVLIKPGRRWRYWLRVIAAMMITSTLAGAITNGVRLVSCRARPTSEVGPGFYPLYNGKERAIFRHAYSSFPSGHAATSAGLFTLAILVSWPLGLLVSLAPLIVGWSRLYFGVHHLSDVTAAMVIAFFVAIWVWTCFMPWLRIKYHGLRGQKLLSGKHAA
ncbi:MAG: phosphatase PAP2 family protein [Candidatus Methylacidiphilales bacterium]